MEKKTIGGFIAALRKANGMTQKDLAQRLNVSDKTVSRWERDDGAPDLAVIPVIAEIFGVTCDELLRGERKSPETRAEAEPTPKGEKQRQRLLKSTLSQYRSRTYIAMGISVVGILAALICNLAFLRAVLGFLIGAIFFVSAIICQAVFVNQAFLSVEDAGLEAAELAGFRRRVITLAQKSIGLTVGCIGFTFPMVLVDAYMGLTAVGLLLWGTIGAAALLLVYGIVLFFLNDALLRRGVYSLPESEAALYRHNHPLKGNCAKALAAAMAVTLVLQLLGSALLWSPAALAESKELVFEDYESFVEFMEQDTMYYAADGDTSVIEWYDENGNPISEEEALTRTLEDSSGNVVCTYMERNTNVCSIGYTPKDGTVLPIRVLTLDAYNAAAQTSQQITVACCLLYPAELLIAVLVYLKKRAK